MGIQLAPETIFHNSHVLQCRSLLSDSFEMMPCTERYVLHHCCAAAGPEGTLRLVLLGEIMAAADFEEDNLYIEYLIQYDPELWDLQTAWSQVEPGLLRVRRAADGWVLSRSRVGDARRGRGLLCLVAGVSGSPAG